MKRERFDKMNVVPFIDIVLVLLVIILATATFVTNQTIHLNLPQSHAQTKENTQYSKIAITKEGGYFFNTQPLSLAALKQKLSTLDPQTQTLAIHTDKETPFHYFVEVIDFLKVEGFEHISIVTKR